MAAAAAEEVTATGIDPDLGIAEEDPALDPAPNPDPDLVTAEGEDHPGIIRGANPAAPKIAPRVPRMAPRARRRVQKALKNVLAARKKDPRAREKNQRAAAVLDPRAPKIAALPAVDPDLAPTPAEDDDDDDDNHFEARRLAVVVSGFDPTRGWCLIVWEDVGDPSLSLWIFESFILSCFI